MKCPAYRNIPESKFDLIVSRLEDKFPDDEHKRKMLREAYARYFDANIPIMYWQLNMNNDFEGDKILLDTYNEIVKDINKSKLEGRILCLAGNFGRGKSLTVCNILKRAVEKGSSGLYITLNDIISATQSQEKYSARKELLTVDFLVIDEFDSRHIPQTDKSTDFFGRVLEDTLRWRAQNMLPLFLCTNSPNPLEAFHGSIKESVSSLWNYVEMIPVLGKDFRAKGKK